MAWPVTVRAGEATAPEPPGKTAPGARPWMQVWPFEELPLRLSRGIGSVVCEKAQMFSCSASVSSAASSAARAAKGLVVSQKGSAAAGDPGLQVRASGISGGLSAAARLKSASGTAAASRRADAAPMRGAMLRPRVMLGPALAAAARCMG